MAKARVYGKNITVTIGSEQDAKIAVCDFDSIEITPTTQVVKYRGIGKIVERSSAIYGGYEIILSRAKSDNALFNLNLAYENLLKKGCSSVNLAVTKQTYYPVEMIDTKYILKEDPNKETSSLMTIGGAILGNAINGIIEKGMRALPPAAVDIQNNITAGLGNAFSVGAELLGVDLRFYDTMKFIGCTIAGYSSSVSESHSEDKESIKLFAPEVVYETNKFQDYYNSYLSAFMEDEYRYQQQSEKSDILVENAQKMLNSIGKE